MVYFLINDCLLIYFYISLGLRFKDIGIANGTALTPN